MTVRKYMTTNIKPKDLEFPTVRLELLQNLLRAMRIVKRKRSVITGDEWECYGICTNVDAQGADADFLEPYFKTFRYYSGDTKFPIKWKQGNQASRKAYIREDNKWVGGYGKRRMQLLNHCIRGVTAEIKEIQAYLTSQR